MCASGFRTTIRLISQSNPTNKTQQSKPTTYKMKRKTMVTTLATTVLLALACGAFLMHPQFGKQPQAARLERIKKSPNYKNGQFQNQSITPAITEGYSYYTVFKEFIFNKDQHRRPIDSLPSKKTDLKSLSRDSDLVVWFGHSSYYIQASGKRFLVDPVFSGSASPIKSTTRSFTGTDIYTADEIPDIDCLIITHDHWDHLDYETMKKMRPRIKQVITGLGVGEHLEYWGFDPKIIAEKDWYEEINLGDSTSVCLTPARHFSGRLFKRNQTLWSSFVLKTPTSKIFIGGDGGYDKHFAEIGKRFGAFDLAILECGQYDKKWKYIHMMPEEVLQATKDLNASKLMPVHWGKFQLANHSWDSPINTISSLCKNDGTPIITPMLGEISYLHQNANPSDGWWKKLK